MANIQRSCYQEQHKIILITQAFNSQISESHQPVAYKLLQAVCQPSPFTLKKQRQDTEKVALAASWLKGVK